MKGKKWKFCNAKLEEVNGWTHKYKCHKCGSTKGLVNVFGRCSVRIYEK
jgi:anaerobic ribonucleoside-triphosphate reductase